MIEITKNKKVIFQGKVIDLELHEVRVGEINTTREIVIHKGAVCAVCVNKDGNLVLVKQFRKSVEDYLLEIPAGKLEKNEKPENAIIREIKEEIGYSVEKISFITDFYTAPGFCNEKIFLYFAFLGEKGDTNFDETENIEIFEMSLAECMNKISTGYIKDAKTILGIMLYKDYLEKI